MSSPTASPTAYFLVAAIALSIGFVTALAAAPGLTLLNFVYVLLTLFYVWVAFVATVMGVRAKRQS